MPNNNSLHWDSKIDVSTPLTQFYFLCLKWYQITIEELKAKGQGWWASTSKRIFQSHTQCSYWERKVLGMPTSVELQVFGVLEESFDY